MNALETIFKNHKNTLAISGDWFVARWAPDIATGEMLNIGVCFVSSDGIKDYRMLDNFDRVSCLYSAGNAVFHARLACEVAEYYFSSNASFDDISLPNLRIEKRGFTQGDDAESVVERLFSAVVPLATPKAATLLKDRFKSMSSKTANTRVINYLKRTLSEDYERYIPEDPYINVKDEFGESRVYLPFIRPGKDKNDAATIASAVYVDQWRAKASLYDGMRDIETALNANRINEGLLAVILPDTDLNKDDRAKIMDEYLTFERYAKRCGVTIKPGNSIDAVGADIYGWLNKTA